MLGVHAPVAGLTWRLDTCILWVLDSTIGILCQPTDAKLSENVT